MSNTYKPSSPVHRISYLEDTYCADIIVPTKLLPEFKTMVKRAMSTWQDATPEMRDFADRVAGIDHIVGQNMKHGHSEQEKKFVPAIKNNFLTAKPEVKPICDGHPETCNCSYHCR